MRDTLGGRPYEVERSGDKYIIKFFPQTSNAKNPDAVLFRLTLSKADLKKLTRLSS